MTKALETRMHLPIGSLDGYRQAVETIPMLTREEERELAEKFQQHNDLDAAWSLVMSHLRFVVRIARGYSGYGLAHADLIQEGNIGLMKAVQTIRPERGCSSGLLCGSLGTRRDPRIYPKELADSQGRNHQVATQAFLQFTSR